MILAIGKMYKDLKYLFLDDIRMPKEVHLYLHRKMYLVKNWIIVRNYDQFVNYIETNGLPYFISFDHDLADEHYVPAEYWKSYETNKQYQESQTYKEKTGYECAKWLVDYCLDNNLECPNFICHSLNPVGKDNINGLLTNFNKLKNK